MARSRLEQTPLVEGALVAIDNRTGHIKAMVGGWDFNRSKFNRAVQAYRQLGSTFKPIVYTTAIDRGFTPASIIMDEPVNYPSSNDQVYSPQNYDHTFEGPVTLRHALEQSRNIPAVRMMETLGPSYRPRLRASDSASRRTSRRISRSRSAREKATLLEVTSAYTAFPNQGVRMKPLEVAEGAGSRRQSARGESDRAAWTSSGPTRRS